MQLVNLNLLLSLIGAIVWKDVHLWIGRPSRFDSLSGPKVVDVEPGEVRKARGPKGRGLVLGIVGS